MPPRVEWQARSMEMHKRRFTAAITPLYDVQDGKIPNPPPSAKEEHVFDFPNGVRMIISREWYAGKRGPCLHLSASAQKWYRDNDMTLSGFMEKVKQLFHELSNHEYSLEYLGKTELVVHWLAYE